MERVSILARARSALHLQRHQSLEAALRQVCEALHAQAEPRSILVSLQAAHEANGLSHAVITIVALVVNELATNAIKHAFEEGQPGKISVTIGRNTCGDIAVTVEDDGAPFPESAGSGDGLGLGLVRRLTASIGGLLLAPSNGSKAFELRVPVGKD
jgi:two-component sensor histidine kinase